MKILFIVFLVILLFGLLYYNIKYDIIPREKRAKEKFNSRDPEEFEIFLAKLDFIPEKNDMELIRQIRRTIAEYGEVSETSVRAEDTIGGSMLDLPGWDSIDWLDFIFSLERATGRHFDRDLITDIFPAPATLENYRKTTVADLIRAIIKYTHSDEEKN